MHYFSDEFYEDHPECLGAEDCFDLMLRAAADRHLYSLHDLLAVTDILERELEYIALRRALVK